LVLVESVGVGQSEIEISQGVDMLVLLVAPGGGDGLQGVKKGIIEVADLLVVNKADGDLLLAAQTTANDYEGAMPFLNSRMKGWESPPVILVSGKTGKGLDDLWKHICKYRQIIIDSGEMRAKRDRQSVYWMWKYVNDLIFAKIRSDQALQKTAKRIEKELHSGATSARAAARELLGSLGSDQSDQ